MVAPSYNCSVEKCKFTHLKSGCSVLLQCSRVWLCFFLKRWKEKIHLPGKKIWFAILILCWLTLWFLGRPGATLHFTPVHTVLTRLLGVLIFYSILKEIPFRPATSTVKNSFFLYAIHFPWARFFNKAGAVLFKGNQGLQQYFSLLCLFLILGISKVLGELLKHTVPGIYEILSGGRGQ